MRIKLTVSYEGTNYFGFQHQADAPNIEDTILNAIKRIDDGVCKIYGSGRTDKLVHARGQVIHFDTCKEIKEYKWIQAINTFLPSDIRVLECEYVSSEFHARHSAKKKEYRYYIRHKTYDIFYRNYMEFIPNMDLLKLEKALNKFVGVHDFRGFCSAQIPEGKPTIKEIYVASMNIFDEYIELIFIGDGFLKYQVRTMVGTLVDIATGKKDEAIIDEIFESLDPKKSTKVLSGCGLYLMNVWY